MRNTKRPYINCLHIASSQSIVQYSRVLPSIHTSHFLAHYKNVDCAQLCALSIRLAYSFIPGAGVNADCPQASTLCSASPTELPLVLALFLEPGWPVF